MSWDKFIKRINNEITNKKPTITRRGIKKINLLEQISNEISAEDQINEKFSDVVKKAGAAVKSGWKKLTNKIKAVAQWGWKFGVAIAKTVGNKFIMFNKKGDMLIPPANDINYNKAPFGENVLTAEYNKTSVGKMDVYLSETMDFGFGVTVNGPKGFGIMHIIEPKQKAVQEGIDYKLSKKLKQLLSEETDDDEEEDEEKLKASMYSLASKLILSAGTSALEKTEDKVEKIRPVEVHYGHFVKMLNELMEKVKSGKVMKGSMVKNIAIYAPTGWGKSMIIKQAAEKQGFHYFPLELQKVALEVVQGFPYLKKVFDDPENASKEDRLQLAKTIVKLAPSEYLPPSGDVDNWLLFFDEFNRADSEKMAAVMNLLLSGELGGASEVIRKKGKIEKIERYHLPKKIVIVLAMNTGQQKGVYDAVNEINNLDIATLERIQQVVFGRYHAASWINNFGGKKFVANFESGESLPLLVRIPGIIISYITKLTQKKSEDPDITAMEAPFLLPVEVAGGKGGGGARTMSPRAWTMVADHMIESGFVNFSRLNDEEKEKLRPKAEQIMKEMEKSGEAAINEKGEKTKLSKNVNDYLFAAYMDKSQTQVSLMSLQACHFGDNGVSIVYDIIRNFKKEIKKGVSHYDILFNYKAVRPLVMKNFTNLGFGTIPRFLAQLLYALEQFKNSSEIETFMKQNKWPVISKAGIEHQLLKTFQQLKKDLNIPDDDFASFLHLIDTRAKKGHDVIRKIHQKAVGEGWAAYEEAIKTKMKTKSQVEKELESLFSEEKKSIPKKEKKEKKEESMNMHLFFKKLHEGGVK